MGPDHALRCGAHATRFAIRFAQAGDSGTVSCIANDAIIRPVPRPTDLPRSRFVRGETFPTALRWYSFGAFWGHLWHLAASVIATEDIDSRDWMEPEGIDTFTGRVGEALGARHPGASLTDRLDQDLFVDFIADSGDDADVGQAVASWLSARYRVQDAAGSTVDLPRGHILLFGGDTAYPVATDAEIHNRVTVPFNRSLRERIDGEPRVLLGIPGNHDWYGGLDGFARMFREKDGQLDRRSALPVDESHRVTQIDHLVEWVEAFRTRSAMHRRPALPLIGYRTVQRATYWALRLAPGISMFAADRQLGGIDFRQRAFFAQARDEDARIALVTADPALAYGEPYPIGQRILESLELELESGLLVLTGDVHHYRRDECGRGQHVIAGGGGAFLHPGRIGNERVPAAEFPGPHATKRLCWHVPLRLGLGRAGWLVHGVFAALLGVVAACTGGFCESEGLALIVFVVLGGLAALVTFLLGGWRNPRARLVALVAAGFGALVGALPYAIARAGLLADYGTLGSVGALVALTFVDATLFGVYLMLLTRLEVEHNQAFSVLAHPGFKHFVRLRVRRDGSAIEGWALGKVDPLDPDEPIALIDHFRWTGR